MAKKQSTDTENVALNLAGVRERAMHVVQMCETIADAVDTGTMERIADNLADPFTVAGTDRVRPRRCGGH